MKMSKRITCLLLVLTLLGMCVPIYAAPEETCTVTFIMPKAEPLEITVPNGTAIGFEQFPDYPMQDFNGKTKYCVGWFAVDGVQYGTELFYNTPITSDITAVARFNERSNVTILHYKNAAKDANGNPAPWMVYVADDSALAEGDIPPAPEDMCGWAYTLNGETKVLTAGSEIPAGKFLIASVQEHKEDVLPGKEPTCTETGLTEGKKCAVCGETTVAQEEIDKLPHTEEVIPGKAATCTETGLTEGKKCTVCGEITVVQEVISALGHTEEVVPGKAATCTETGLTDGVKCTACGEILKAQEEIPAVGHAWDDGVVTTEPTEEAEGVKTYTCSVCDATRTETIPALGHTHHLTYVEAKAATCTAEGNIEYWLCTCGKYFRDENATEEISGSDITVPKIPHTEETLPAVPATCTETGLTEGEACSVCGEVLTAQEEIPATGHTVTIVAAVPATCTETGLTEGEACSVCGEVLIAQEVTPAVGHTEEVVPGKAPTCTETGLTEGKKCAVCGEILTAQEVIPAVGDHHLVVVNAEKPGLLQPGYTGDLVCDQCGKIFSYGSIIPAYGTYTGVTVPNRPAKEMNFADVHTYDWFYDDVKYVYDNGLMNGVSDTQFSPNATLTRAMIVTILYRIEGEPATRYNGRFSDVPTGTWYTAAVEWAAQEGIVNGYDMLRYGPTDAVTREQMATILHRYTAYRNGYTYGRADLSSIAGGSSVSGYAVDAVSWAVAQDMLDSSSLRPRAAASRAEVAMAIARLYENLVK